MPPPGCAAFDVVRLRLGCFRNRISTFASISVIALGTVHDEGDGHAGLGRADTHVWNTVRRRTEIRMQPPIAPDEVDEGQPTAYRPAPARCPDSTSCSMERAPALRNHPSASLCCAPLAELEPAAARVWAGDGAGEGAGRVPVTALVLAQALASGLPVAPMIRSSEW